MKRFLLFFLLLIPAMITYGQTGIAALLPVNGDMPGWTLSSDGSVFRGESLELALDGEADLVNEYGFRELIRARMEGEDGTLVEVDIYRMKDSFGAFAVYLMKNPGDLEQCEFGNECVTGNSTLAFWKLHYAVFLRTASKGIPADTSLNSMASYIDSRIKATGKWPEVFSRAEGSRGRVSLIRGTLSLSHVYHFTSRNIFRIQEGVAVEDGARTEIFLRYQDQNESVQRLGEVAGFLSRDGRFKNFTMTGQLSFTMNDDSGKLIEITSEGYWLKINIEAVPVH